MSENVIVCVGWNYSGAFLVLFASLYKLNNLNSLFIMIFHL